MNDLPHELLHKILLNLHPHEVINVGLISKHINREANDENLWCGFVDQLKQQLQREALSDQLWRGGLLEQFLWKPFLEEQNVELEKTFGHGTIVRKKQDGKQSLVIDYFVNLHDIKNFDQRSNRRIICEYSDLRNKDLVDGGRWQNPSGHQVRVLKEVLLSFEFVSKVRFLYDRLNFALNGKTHIGNLCSIYIMFYRWCDHAYDIQESLAEMRDIRNGSIDGLQHTICELHEDMDDFPQDQNFMALFQNCFDICKQFFGFRRKQARDIKEMGGVVSLYQEILSKHRSR